MTIELSERQAFLLKQLLNSITEDMHCSNAEKYVAQEIKDVLEEHLLAL